MTGRERDEFRETAAAAAHRLDGGNPEPSRRYTAGRCRDYLGAVRAPIARTIALDDRLERPAPHPPASRAALFASCVQAKGEEIVRATGNGGGTRIPWFQVRVLVGPPFWRA
jgi:hypothetical protein